MGYEELTERKVRSVYPVGRWPYNLALHARFDEHKDEGHEFLAARHSVDEVYNAAVAGTLRPPLTESLFEVVNVARLDMGQGQENKALPAARVLLDVLIEFGYGGFPDSPPPRVARG